MGNAKMGSAQNAPAAQMSGWKTEGKERIRCRKKTGWPLGHGVMEKKRSFGSWRGQWEGNGVSGKTGGLSYKEIF